MQFVQCSYAKLTIVTLESWLAKNESMAQKNRHKFKFLYISKCEYVMHSSNRIYECDQIQTIEYLHVSPDPSSGNMEPPPVEIKDHPSSGN